MNTKTYRLIINLSVFIIATIFSCKKTDTVITKPISTSDVYIHESASVDTLSQAVSVERDSIVTIKIQAALRSSETIASNNHVVVFAVDTTQMAAYNNRYGVATLLPLSNYFLAFNTSIISNNSTSYAELNIANESQLTPLSTYILPLIIKSIDGQEVSNPDNNQVLYIIIKTLPIDYGNPIDKTGWSILSYSSALSSTVYPANNLLDNDINTFWGSALNAPMPQYVVIDMAKQYNLRAITFTSCTTAGSGGDPEEVLVELSLDGTQWINAGTYVGTTINVASLLHRFKILPTTAARYIRFTVLKASYYVIPSLTLVELSEIGAND